MTLLNHFYLPFLQQKVALITLTFLSSFLVNAAQPDIVVAPRKLNVLYLGVDNPVDIATIAGNDNKVTVSINAGDTSA